MSKYKVKSNREHKSINIGDINENFDSNVIILTGLNGSGKSHILEAISNGSVIVNKDNISINNLSSPVYDYKNFEYNSIDDIYTKSFDKFKLEKLEKWQPYNPINDTMRAEFKQIKDLIGRKLIFEVNINEIPTGKKHLFKNFDNLLSLHNSLISSDEDYKIIYDICLIEKKEFIELNIEHIPKDILEKSYNSLFLGKLEPIFTSFYRDLDLARKLTGDDTYEDILKCYNDEKDYNPEYIKCNYSKHSNEIMMHIIKMKKRWLFSKDIVTEYNNSLKEIESLAHLDGLKYIQGSDAYFERNNKRISIKDLSSGQRILFAINNMIFRGKLSAEKPSIILFDEIDATLNPSLSKQLHDIIYRELKDCLVIFATHNPSTVALFPEDSIYWVNMPGSTNRVEKKSKKDVVYLLSKDVINFTIDVTNTKNVFVEDNADKDFYELIYKQLLLDGYIDRNNPVMNFISSSKRGSGGVQAVVNLVEALHDGNNNNIFGIVDYDDGKLNCDLLKKRIFFVNDSESRRFVENYIFDPITLSRYLCGLNRECFTEEQIYKDLDLIRDSVKNINDMLYDNSDIANITEWIHKGLNLGQKCIEIKYANSSTINVDIKLINSDKDYYNRDLITKLKLKDGLLSNDKITNFITKNGTLGFVPKEFLNLYNKILTTIN